LAFFSRLFLRSNAYFVETEASTESQTFLSSGVPRFFRPWVAPTCHSMSGQWLYIPHLSAAGVQTVVSTLRVAGSQTATPLTTFCPAVTNHFTQPRPGFAGEDRPNQKAQFHHRTGPSFTESQAGGRPGGHDFVPLCVTYPRRAAPTNRSRRVWGRWPKHDRLRSTVGAVEDRALSTLAQPRHTLLVRGCAASLQPRFA
jgi:hypothetical protein